MEPIAGDIVGSYQLVRRLGSGAMGEVWLGAHTRSKASAAVKQVRRDRHGRARLAELFARERRAIVRLSHPHIVPLFELGDEHIAMAYLSGADLARRLRTPMEPAEAIHIIRQIASALAHAHARGVVHRDVKPSNILLDRRGNAFLADFGLAMIADEHAGPGGGTPGFMAPEQARGDAVGPAADQYGLARTLMEMLAGARLPGDQAEALRRLPPALPAALRVVLERATAPDPSARWPSMDALSGALAHIDLRGHAAPTALAPEVRVREPFRWCTAPHRKTAVGLDLERAEYRLDDLERAGALPAEACATFRARTGYATLGWAMFGRAGRLGPIDTAASLARASDVVVLLHGWLETREIWRDIAAALCRDNAQTVVLVPDVGGFGESRFTGDRPRPEHLAPPAMARAVLRWLELLTLRDLPTVIVGHSLSGMHLLAIDPAELGDAVGRIALTPIYPFVDAATRRRLLRAELSFPILRGPLRRLLVGAAVTRSATTAELTDEERDAMVEQLLAAPAAVLAGTARSIRSMQPRRGDDLRDCIVVVGAKDPSANEEVVRRGLAYLELPATNVEHMATGGHYPHVESEAHPEWTAQNAARLVEIIDAALAGCREGTPLSTVMASTAISATSRDTEPAAPERP